MLIIKGEDLEKQNNYFNKTSKEILEKSKKEITENFKALENATKNINPICLLSQLILSVGASSGAEKIFLERKWKW